MKSRLVVSLFIAFLFVSPFASAVPITSSSDTALAGATLVDFDEYTTNRYLGDFTNGNVSFVNTNRYGSNYFSYTASLPGMSGRYISLYSSGDMVFSTAVSAVSFDLGAFNDPWIIQAFASDGNLIESTSVNVNCCNVATYGFAANDIASIKLLTSSSDIIVMDNLRYVSTTVPEPSTLSLLLVVLIGILFARQLKRNRCQKTDFTGMVPC